MKKLTPVTLPFGRARLATSPPCSGPARPERRPAAASQRSLQACIASLPLQSFLMSKTYLKSDHFNGGGSTTKRRFASKSEHACKRAFAAAQNCRILAPALRRTLARCQDRAVRLPIVRNLDRPDAVEQIGGDVVRHCLAKRRQRPLVVCAPHGNAERPRINRCAAPRAHDDIEFRLAVRAPAE